MPRPRKPREDDPWPQRDRFMALVDAKVASGVSLEEIAAAIGLKTTTSLDTAYRYDRRRRPKRTTLEAAAKFFGVDLAEIDGGTDEREDFLANLSEGSRAQFYAMARAWAGNDLSDEERSILFDHMLSDKSRIVATREQIRAMNRK